MNRHVPRVATRQQKEDWRLGPTVMVFSHLCSQTLESKSLEAQTQCATMTSLTPPLPLWQGLWPSWVSSARASAFPSLPAANITSRGPLETLRRVTVRGKGIDGQEPTYCVHLLGRHFTQPSPTRARSFFTPTYWLTDLMFLLALLSPVFIAVHLPSSPLSTAAVTDQQPFQQDNQRNLPVLHLSNQKTNEH